MVDEPKDGKVFLKVAKEGYQPDKRGYQPTNDNPSAKPPQGGSGVPAKPVATEVPCDNKK